MTRDLQGAMTVFTKLILNKKEKISLWATTTYISSSNFPLRHPQNPVSALKTS